jgi:hypothetical protein
LTFVVFFAHTSKKREVYLIIACFYHLKQNAITHRKITNDEGINQVKFLWTAPNNLSERVNFVATIAKNGGIFWVAEKSDTLTINK